MDTVFMNIKHSKTSGPPTRIVNFTDKIKENS